MNDQFKPASAIVDEVSLKKKNFSFVQLSSNSVVMRELTVASYFGTK